MKYHNLRTIDLVIVILYFIGMLCVGAYCARKQKSTKEYFLAGSSMGWFTIGISIVATLMSVISYLSTPGEIIAHGLGLSFIYLAYPISYLIIARLIIPFYLSLKITSAYEYLERRFNISVRLMGAILFITTRVVWMGVILYSCSLAMGTIVGSPLVPTIITVGIITTLYSGMGGIRAVIITDVIQFSILLGGAFITLLIIGSHLGGLTLFSKVFHDVSSMQYPIISLDPTVRLSVLGIIVWGLSWNICTYGSDQIVIQRYLTVRDANTVKFSIAINFIFDFILFSVLALVGLSLLAFYTANGHLLPAVMAGNLKQSGDKLFPHFISFELPVGVCGLVIASLFAAAMSSLSSGINSVTTVVTTDIRERFFRSNQNGGVRFARGLSFFIGGFAILLGCGISLIKGNLVEVTNKATACFIGPLFAIFALGMFSKRANGSGALIGAFAGVTAGILITYWGQWFDTPSISFMWLIPSSCAVAISVGLAVSLLGKKPETAQIEDFTLRGKHRVPMKQPAV